MPSPRSDAHEHWYKTHEKKHLLGLGRGKFTLNGRIDAKSSRAALLQNYIKSAKHRRWDFNDEDVAEIIAYAKEQLAKEAP